MLTGDDFLSPWIVLTKKEVIPMPIVQSRFYNKNGEDRMSGCVWQRVKHGEKLHRSFIATARVISGTFIVPASNSFHTAYN